MKQFSKPRRICSLKMLTSGGSLFGTSCSISMLTSFVWYFVGFYFFVGGMEHWCDWDWGGGGRPGLPWAESFPNSWRDHIISTSNQNCQGYLNFSFPDWKCWLCLALSLSNLCLMKSTCVLSADLAWLFMTHASECCVDVVLFKLEDAKNRYINIYMDWGFVCVVWAPDRENQSCVLRCQ